MTDILELLKMVEEFLSRISFNLGVMVVVLLISLVLGIYFLPKRR